MQLFNLISALWASLSLQEAFMSANLRTGWGYLFLSVSILVVHYYGSAF